MGQAKEVHAKGAKRLRAGLEASEESAKLLASTEEATLKPAVAVTLGKAREMNAKGAKKLRSGLKANDACAGLLAEAEEAMFQLQHELEEAKDESREAREEANELREIIIEYRLRDTREFL